MSAWFLAGWIAAFGADGVTTQRALHQGRVELLLPAPAISLTAQAVMGPLVIKKLGKKHPKAAKIAYWAIVGSHTFGAVWNTSF